MLLLKSHFTGLYIFLKFRLHFYVSYLTIVLCLYNFFLVNVSITCPLIPAFVCMCVCIFSVLRARCIINKRTNKYINSIYLITYVHMCNLNAMDTDKPFSFGSQV